MPTFDIPALDTSDLDQVVGELGDLDATLLAEQARALDLLDGVNATDVTPERLAWLILWSQLFAALRSVQAAVVFRSRLLLESTWRFTLEVFLHLLTILEPALDEEEEEISDELRASRLEEVERRLMAFAAWCLWNDDHHIDWVLDPRTLQSLGTLAEDAPREDELSAVRMQREQIWDLMDTEALDPWIRKMDRRRDGPEARQVYSFYELLGLETTSVSQRLLTLDSSASIGAYSRASVVMHASTANHFLAVQEGRVRPRLPDGTPVESASTPYITAGLNLLDGIKAHLWPQ